MDYLMKFNLTAKDIEDIINNIDNMDLLEFNMYEERISKIISYLLSKNITNIKDIIIKKTMLFYETFEHVKELIDSCNKEMIYLLNDDATNFSLLGI